MDLIIHNHSGVHTLVSKQVLHQNIDAVWEFFSHPKNLDWMTPPDMKFKITSPELPDKTYQGQIITYDIFLLPNLPTNWVTEITLVKEQELFIDEQRFGPYTMWHHEHHFIKDGEHTLMVDKITYKLPMGILGDLVAQKIIEKKLMEIFTFRYHFCERCFNKI